MFTKVLIANRGEIAVRIARTLAGMGVGSIAVYSDVDRNSKHVRACDEAVHLPGVAPADTYLDGGAIIAAAHDLGAEAIHPGYGFLSESADFAARVRDAGLVWIGPPAEAIRALGDKISARRIAASAGVPVVPGLLSPVEGTDVIHRFAAENGFPVAVKAAGGGGGRGLKVARSETEIGEAFASARREAEAYFGSSEVYIERYLDAPKHLEVQLLAPSDTEALWLGVRDCSLQRRHQKLIEETPPPLWAEKQTEMGEAAVALSLAAGYVGAGTVEMLVDSDGNHYFLEVNSRLQVEHTVTEEVTGIDLIACQVKIAAGDPLGFEQGDIELRGHSIECRINAEDPVRSFVPTPGMLSRYDEPGGPGVRVDSGYEAGDEIPPAYDSLIAKVVTLGSDRDEARARMVRALQEFRIEGVSTTIAAHLELLDHAEFIKGVHTTRTVEAGALDALTASQLTAEENVLLVGGDRVHLWNPAMAASAAAAVRAGSGEVVAPMQGTVLAVVIEEGADVEEGGAIAVLEAMKMETTIAATRSGTVVELRVKPGSTVGSGDVIAVIE